jgi:hypothetical protein
MVITAASPLGSRLWKRRAGERVELSAGRAASAVEIEGLRGRMREFGAGVAATRAAVLELTVDDLNTLLAAEPQGRGMREFAGVEAITAAAMGE